VRGRARPADEPLALAQLGDRRGTDRSLWSAITFHI
jgi:hypothetical protein